MDNSGRTIHGPELVPHSPEEYEQLALELWAVPKNLQRVKEKLLINRKNSVLFNTELFTTKLEDAFRQTHRRYLDGLEPEMICVK
ncbi:MAG: hypothetical protein VYA17_10065 [Pseudomonadota bacterium]|nr:hypothetical protein [Pseudomonadota bacterium]